MDYDSKKEDYKKDTESEEKYYVVEDKKPEETIAAAPTFESVFQNIPKGGSIAAMPGFHDGVVYFSSLDTYVYAVDANTGEMIWKFKTGAPAMTAPLVHNKRVYFGSHDEHFYCLDLAGKLIWKKHLGDIIVSYPTGVADKIFIAAGKTFFCLSENGEELWRFVTGDGIFTSPTLVNETIFISSFDKHIYALDMSGNLKWKFGAGHSISTPLIFSDNKALFTLKKRSWDAAPRAENPILYSASADNNLYALNQKGEIIWKFNCGSSFFTIVTGDNGTVYVGSITGHIYAVDAVTGKQKWNFRTGGMITGGIALKDDMVYVDSWDQKIYCLSANGEKLWDFLTGGPIVAEPLIAGNKIYFGSADTFFYCLDAEKRTVEWTFQCGFGMPDILKTKITDVANTFTEHDKKIFRVWVPETRAAQMKGQTMDNYNTPAGFNFGGEQSYSSSNASAYKSGTNYLSKRKPYNK